MKDGGQSISRNWLEKSALFYLQAWAHFIVLGQKETLALHLGHAIQVEKNLQMFGNFGHLYGFVFVRKLRFQWMFELRTWSDPRGRFTS